MHNYGDSGPSGLRPVSIIMPFAFGYALRGGVRVVIVLFLWLGEPEVLSLKS